MLAQRQPDLTVVLENVHDPHNVSAILRSCDGVGVLQAHAVYSIEEPPPGMFARQTSASAPNGLTSRGTGHLPTATSAYERWFRHSGHEHRAEFAPLSDWDLTGPICVGLWQRDAGVLSRGARHGRRGNPDPDGRYGGEPERLVACAVCLYEAFRQKTVAGHYELPKLAADRLRALEEDWLRR